jgi:hypothetical protein
MVESRMHTHGRGLLGVLRRVVEILAPRRRVPARDLRDATPTQVCPKCGGKLQVYMVGHFLGPDGSGYTNWALCPGCRQLLVRSTEPRSLDDWGWQVDRDPPESGREWLRRHQSSLYDRELDR